MYFILLLLGLIMSACTDQNINSNQLKNEKSLYLQMHIDNPIWWQPWGEKAFKEAEKKNKLVFLSIGYSTCHWCHVMEKDSFEKQDVADALNKKYISIKIDREERPDLDAFYMQAVQAMNGGTGGWPMTLILTPDKKPIIAATYIPRLQLLELLNKIEITWSHEPKKLKDRANGVMKWLKENKNESQSSIVLSDEIFKKFTKDIEKNFDKINGGHLGSPKFPTSYSDRMLLRVYRRSGNQKALDMVKKTLSRISLSGTYDQIMGGFHRYSTDAQWLVPHFEKMLYDQSALAKVYLEAFQVTKNKEYKILAQEILDYVLKDMTDLNGGFYSAEDADSEGEEGKFAVWTYSELKSILSVEEFLALKKEFIISPNGNFEHHTNILELQKKHLRSVRSNQFVSALKKLKEVRYKRIRPFKDTKIITAWNGLMISAFAMAYRILNEKKYLSAAQKSAEFILEKHLKAKGLLLRRSIDGEVRFTGTLQDYSFFIDGLIELYQSDFNPKWFKTALQLQTQQDKFFWDEKDGGYFDSAESVKDVLIRKKDLFDNVRPSGNSISALNLLRIGSLSLNKKYRKQALKIIQLSSQYLKSHPSSSPQLLMALDYLLDRSKEVALIGDIISSDTQKMLHFLRKDFNPNMVIANHGEFALLKGKTKIKDQATSYICEQGVCHLPTNDFNQARKILSTMNRY